MTATENIVETRPAPFTWARSAGYSQGAKANDLVFTSGEGGFDDAGHLVERGVEAFKTVRGEHFSDPWPTVTALQNDLLVPRDARRKGRRRCGRRSPSPSQRLHHRIVAP